MAFTSETTISIQPLVSHDHIDAAVSLQRAIWGYSDIDLDSRAILTVVSRLAGQLIGAFDAGRLIGFALAFGTLSPNRLHSHRVGVLPEYQNHGVGRRLKLAQREDALEKGIHTIQWTFDPLQPRNAYLNLVRLGGIAKTYIPNLYGVTSSLLHGGLPTDRLLIEWQLESRRVCEVLAGRSPEISEDTWEIDLPASGERHNIAALKRLREEFLQRLNEGYVVTSFRENATRGFYILEKSLNRPIISSIFQIQV